FEADAAGQVGVSDVGVGPGGERLELTDRLPVAPVEGAGVVDDHLVLGRLPSLQRVSEDGDAARERGRAEQQAGGQGEAETGHSATSATGGLSPYCTRPRQGVNETARPGWAGRG